MNRKLVKPTLRDSRRTFSGEELRQLLHECRAHCSHPMCDYPHLSLRAHHIIQHAYGGLTVNPNGLMLCTNCHRRLHDGFIPTRLAFLIKNWLSSGEASPLPLNTISPDEMVAQAEKTTNDISLSANVKFTRLNDILIAANFLPSRNARLFVFVNVLASKTKTLNDGVSPLRSTLNAMLISMDNRRAWAQMVAASALRYAKEINHHWLGVYFIHSRAVGFNARNRFDRAVAEFRKALNFLDHFPSPQKHSSEVQILESRLLREMGVCMAKNSQSSTKGKKNILASFEMANAIGDTHNIDDALIRCTEGFIYLNDIPKAERYLQKLYGNWPRLDSNLKAITMKMNAKLALAQNETTCAEDIISQGSEWCSKYHLHHQSYHFARLGWHISLRLDDNRAKIMT